MTTQTIQTRLHNIKLLFGDTWPLVTTTILSGIILFFAYGCEPKVSSIIDPTKEVTRDELRGELDYLLMVAAAKEKDLNKKQELQNLVFNNVLLIADGGAVNPLGVLTTLLSVLGIGAIGDDVRLRRQRKRTPVLDKTNPE